MTGVTDVTYSRRVRRLPLLAPLLALPLALPLAVAPVATTGAAADDVAAARAGSTAQTRHTGFDSREELQRGRTAGAEVRRGRVVLTDGTLTRSHGGRTYDVGRWVSPWVEPGFALTELVPSWEARTPGDSWVEVEVRGQAASGKRSSWDVMARWAYGDRFLQRTTVSGQDDDLASVSVDTWKAPAGLTRYRLRVSLLRRAGASTVAPSLGYAGAVASAGTFGGATSRPGVASRKGGTVLDVPRYSQMVHQGHYPQWGGGGEAWCSPTSISMVLAFHDALPSAKEYAWVADGHASPWVDHAARMTYDHGYGGTGNWAFNTAYAARQTGRAHVTRFTSLRAVEKLVARGLPAIISIAFGPGELSGAPISSSNGHLLVVSGFTGSGDVVVNDPAADGPAGVRRTYDRGQLERAWLTASKGTTYVVRP